MARLDTGGAREMCAGRVFRKEIRQGERKVLRIRGKRIVHCREYIFLRNCFAQLRGKTTQRANPALADYTICFLSHHAEVADDRSIVVGQRAVRKGMVRLLRVAAALEKEQ